ncbi:cytochrome c-type biogenesis protein [Maricaulis sp.]|uniref:cytochrome c-type biogenesis protein n=1 Tax=Maricaulis sp. TaxID=1486257 RepID=UPI00261F8EB8|nr:cytochrome c-type biogenesis protein [Maricaulis sp.]
MMRFSLILLALLISLSAQALARPGPDEIMDDPELEARAMVLYRQLRCVVCQSQSIGDSNADLASDMRVVVRERLLAGDSDAEVRAYLQQRYGDYVLMLPPVQANTLVLWGFPIVLLLFAGGLAFFFVRRQDQAGETELSPEEEAQLAALKREEGLE